MTNSWKLLCASAIIVLLPSCASEIGKPRSMDSDEVTHNLQRITFTIPDGFAFAQGATHSEFSGQPAWSARFDAPNELGDGLTLSAANPSYPPLQPFACQTVPPGSWAGVNFTCESEMLTTSAEPKSTTDPVTVLLTRDGQRSSLYIYCPGH
ncbi:MULTISPECIES: hypothetical protein [Nocardiaceae]|uniref:hypothetical protein n=1 Tax=Nocardiaceae TaxID=85025 RepID=UPI00050C4515|nr:MULTISPECIES: hypothetical protein [Rhodococcus]MBY4383361.1 hypothetical protein [Rhodococcus fascians]MBY4398036.1 hypothetical protein [Rhodococcus fascians]MBY4409214.1 hypothetical protein [Rhodococcus fascians]MBY4422809.1 hypothetical protein [Rhodococcus fascians]MBY4462399.1 hypothetical protein [Rhodococcus fascians]